MKKWWVKLLLCLGAIVLILTAGIFSFSLHSKSAVDQYKDKLRAAGEKLSIQELVPTRPDPDQNGESLFNDATRSLNPFLTGVLGSNSPPAMRMIASGKAMIEWQQPEIVSPLYPGFATNSWEDIELALQTQSSVLESIRQTAERPQLVFNLDYNLGLQAPVSHLSKVREASLLLFSAAMDALHRRDSAGAVTNIHEMLSLVNAWKEPILLSQMVRNSISQFALSGQWELFQATNVTDHQLALLQRDWMDTDFIQSVGNAFLMDRLFMCCYIQNLRGSNSPSLYPGLSSSSGGSGDWLEDLKDFGRSAKRKTSEALWRASWSYSDEVSILEGSQVLIEAVRQVQTNGYFKNALAERDRKLTALGMIQPGTNWLRDELDDDFTVMVVDSVQGESRLFDRLLTVEAARCVAITSIAVKRYQLRHAKLPPDLNALVPEFLPQVPRDPVDGHPLRYQVTSDNSFLLYSIGKDGVDNGGDPTPDGKIKGWLRGRDWVWPQPANEGEIQYYYNNPPK